MRLLRCRYPALPRSFARHPKIQGLLFEKDIKVTPKSRLCAKLLIFKNQRSLHYFWKVVLGKGSLGRYCKGAVNSLIQEVGHYGKREKERHWLEADPRYFCIIGLVKNWTSAEVVSHESVHAAFSYIKRINRSPWSAQAKHFDEEEICYPAGRISSEIARFLWDSKLLS